MMAVHQLAKRNRVSFVQALPQTAPLPVETAKEQHMSNVTTAILYTMTGVQTVSLTLGFYALALSRTLAHRPVETD